jgi:hypothetical protein
MQLDTIKTYNSKSVKRSINDLDEILSPACNMAIWKRPLSPAPQAIQELVDSSFQALQFVYDRSQSIELVGAYFDEHLDLKSHDAYFLCEDFMNIAKKFVSLCSDQSIGIRLERVTNDNCKAFHVDFLSLRLLCTYHGPATDWVDNSNVNRKYLGKNRNDLVIKNESLIKSFKTNWVGVLKGENYADNKGKGVVHRSPQISTLEKADRILLRMDTLERFGSHK